MRIDDQRLYAVVTGDVVASSRLSAARRRELHRAMTAASGDVRSAWPDALLGEVDIYRGDGWQMALARPVSALRAALHYRAGLRARMGSHTLDVRMAMAIGTIDFIPGERVSEGDGEAFRSSGEALEQIGRGVGMRLRFPTCSAEEAIDTVVRLVDALAARWSDRQALAVTGALRGWSQEKIGKECWAQPITQQAVQQHLDRAAWSAIDTALGFFEREIAACLE